jgi:hypothetical protein
VIVIDSFDEWTKPNQCEVDCVKLEAIMTTPKSLLLPLLAMSPSPFAAASRTNIFDTDQRIRITPQPRAVDLKTCYYNLLQAAFYGSTVTQSDFITFVQLSSNHTHGHVNQWGMNITGFNMLNPEFVGIYNLYACGDPLVGCPSIEGIDIGEGGSALVSDGGDEGLLSGICSDMYETIEVLSSSAPTKGPTIGGASSSPTTASSGGVSSSPNGAGLSSPTASPSSPGTSAEGAPTYYPSYIPSKSPVVGGATTPPILPTGGSSSPTGAATSVGIVCPAVYVPDTFYEAFDQVTNPNDDSSGTKIYECKDAPYTPWCSQAAYEPGVAMPWSEAWHFVGYCSEGWAPTVSATEVGSTVGPITTANITSWSTTNAVTNPDLTTVSPITTETVVTTTPSGATDDEITTVGSTTGPETTISAGTTGSSNEEGVTPSPTALVDPDGEVYDCSSLQINSLA